MQIGILYYLNEDSYIQSDSLLPIQLGYRETGVDMGIQRDDTGDNRSDRHSIYSEFSGIYWVWKNVRARYKGIFQHRRSLVLNNKCSQEYEFLRILVSTKLKNIIKNSRNEFQFVLKCNDHKDYVEKLHKAVSHFPTFFEEGYDIIAPKPYQLIGSNVYEHFDEVINRGLMGLLKPILLNKYSSYFEIFNSSLKDTKMYYANISIMKESLFDEYCEFVFGVFDELERALIDDKYFINLYKEKSMYRIFGYIGELLTNVYIRKKREEGYKVKELCLLYDRSVKGNESLDYSSLKL